MKALCWAECKPITRGVSFSRVLVVEGGSKEIGGRRDGASLQDGEAGLVM